ncbi:MAG: peptide-methionine (S)-S-oxide reductase MsrA [Novosphingobium sp.]
MKRSAQTFAALILTLAFASACQQAAVAASPENAVNAPAAARTANEGAGLKTAIFAGGCYWGVEGVFSHINGVTSAVSGFEGGGKNTAEYETVSGGNTGHAESVKVTYDPAKIRYDQLLQVFFSVVADPTQLNRQGPDTGTQYRSALVPLNAEQKAVAATYLAQMKAAHLWKAPIVTRIEDFKGFYPAAPDHQDFMAENPNHPYIQYWDVAKVSALKRLFPRFYKPSFTRG